MKIGVSRIKGPPSEFAYVLSKAQLYCKIGRDKYRKSDFHKMPPIDASAEILEVIDRGMEQISNNRGWCCEMPLEGIGIAGFYELVSTLHFSVKMQKTVSMDQTHIVDEMHLEHEMLGTPLVLFNKVPRFA